MLSPTWKLEDRSGGPTLIVGGFCYHGGEDPVRYGRLQAMEACVLLEKSKSKKALLIGFGLGYLAAPLSAMTEVPLFIWDSLPVAQKERRERWLAAGKKAEFLLNEDEVERVLDADTVILAHQGTQEIHFWELSFCEAAFARLNTQRLKTVSKRSIDFLSRWPSLGLVEEHYGVGKGKDVVIVSPGPTMDVGKIGELKKRGYPVMCCAQAAVKLTQNNIAPDIIVCLDPQPVIREAIKDVHNFGAIYTEAMSDPGIWEDHPDRCFVYSVPAAHVHSLVWRDLGYRALDLPAVTVSEQMLQLAHELRFESVITSGIDYWSPVRTPLMKMECALGRWSWAHYYGGSRAWEYLIRKFAMDWDRTDDLEIEAYPEQEPITLPPPSTQVSKSYIDRKIGEMLRNQPQEIAQKVMSALPASIRADFSPLTVAPPSR